VVITSGSTHNCNVTCAVSLVLAAGTTRTNASQPPSARRSHASGDQPEGKLIPTAGARPEAGKDPQHVDPHLSVDREPRAVLARLRPAAEVRDRHGGDAWSPSRSARDAARMLRSSIARSRHSSPSTGEYCVNSHARQKCVRCGPTTSTCCRADQHLPGSQRDAAFRAMGRTGFHPPARRPAQVHVRMVPTRPHPPYPSGRSNACSIDGGWRRPMGLD
jgi:hypothetical protein